MQTISNQYISLSNSVILQDNTLYDNCIINVTDNTLITDNKTISFKDCLIASGVDSEGNRNYNDSGLRVGKNCNVEFDNCNIYSGKFFRVEPESNTTLLFNNCPEIYTSSFVVYNSNLTMNGCELYPFGDNAGMAFRGGNYIFNNSTITMANFNTISINNNTNIKFSNCQLNDLLIYFVNFNGFISNYNSSSFPVGNDNVSIDIENSYIYTMPYGNKKISKDNYKQFFIFTKPQGSILNQNTLYGAKLYIDGEEIKYMSEKYLKDIYISIDNRIIATDTNGNAIINKVPIGLQPFSVFKDGYLPITNQKINVPTELTKNYDVEIINNSYKITAKPSNAIISVTRYDISGQTHTAQYEGQTPVISGSFGDLVEYSVTCQNFDTMSGSFYLKNPQQNGLNDKVFKMQLPRGTLYLYVTNLDGFAISGATVNIANKSFVTDENGLVVLENLAYKSYQFSVTGQDLKPYSSVAVVDSSQNYVYAPLEQEVTYAFATDNSIVANDNVIINAGMATSDYKWSAYLTSNNSMINDLSLNATVKSISNGVIEIEGEPSNNADITVTASQDNSVIEFNNDNEIDDVTINVTAFDNYIAFTQNSKTMYFKNNTLPFISSENAFASKSYTYYTYENNVMVSHTATTSSVTVGTNSYDGNTLKLDTTDSFSNGSWTKDQTKDIEIDDNSAIITTNTYLTTPQAIIPRSNYFRFAVGKLNTSQWETKLIIGGQEKNFINYQEFLVTSNQKIEIYQTKKGSTNLVDSYGQYFYISNDKIFKKLKYIVTSNVAGSTFKFTVNGAEFTYEGSSANIEVYEGQTISWQVSAEGYTTQSGTYTVASYPTIDSYTNAVTLVQA